MADTRLSQETAITGANLASADLFDVLDVSDTTDAATGTNKSITRDELFRAVGNRVTAITSNATWTINADTTDLFIVTAQAVPVTSIPNPSGTPVQGQRLRLRYTDDGTPRAISGWGTKFRVPYAFTVTLPTSTLGVTNYVDYVYNATDDKWDIVGFQTYSVALIDTLLAAKAGSNPVATDTLWAANGDILVGTANDAGTRMGPGAIAGTALVADPNAARLIGYDNPLSAADAASGTTGCLASTYNRAAIASSAVATAQTGGTLYLYAIYLPKGITVATLTFWAGTTAGATNTHSWAGLYSSARVNRAISADDTTATWTASNLRAFAMTTPYQTTASGLFYVGLCIVGGTIPTIESVTGLLTAGSRLAAPRPDTITNLTGQTTPVTTTPGLGAMLGQHAYCEVT